MGCICGVWQTASEPSKRKYEEGEVFRWYYIYYQTIVHYNIFVVFIHVCVFTEKKKQGDEGSKLVIYIAFCLVFFFFFFFFLYMSVMCVGGKNGME